MSEKNETFDNGQVKISDDVVSIIAGIAATEIKGVHSMHTGIVDGFSNLFSKNNNYSKGVKVDIKENIVVVHIFINVEYGCKISSVAQEVQKAVKKEIETMTDLTVSGVHVHVQNIVTEKDKDKEKIEEEK